MSDEFLRLHLYPGRALPSESLKEIDLFHDHTYRPPDRSLRMIAKFVLRSSKLHMHSPNELCMKFPSKPIVPYCYQGAPTGQVQRRWALFFHQQTCMEHREKLSLVNDPRDSRLLGRVFLEGY
jgi:hypothetical protein